MYTRLTGWAVTVSVRRRTRSANAAFPGALSTTLASTPAVLRPALSSVPPAPSRSRLRQVAHRPRPAVLLLDETTRDRDKIARHRLLGNSSDGQRGRRVGPVHRVAQ